MVEALHIFAQHYWHDEAYVVGDRDSLIVLRDALDRAIANGISETPTDSECLATNDGEGYVVRVLRLEPDDEAIVWMAVPYTDADAAPAARSRDSHSPSDLWILRDKR